MAELVEEIDSYLRRLFPICRSITGEGNRETLRILQEVVPLTIYEVPSGTPVYDWVVPEEWNIRQGWIAGPDGRRLVDFQANNLHIVSYSVPVSGIFCWDELKAHLHIHPRLPEAIPYRTSYYKRDWGFCLTHSQYREIEALEGPFEVLVDSTLESGSLSYGEVLIPGQSKQEILISTYICHPSMANDNLSGVILTAFLSRELIRCDNLRYSYRIVFIPETIGALAYLARNEEAMKRIDLGLVIATVGGPGKFGYKQSFNSSHVLNRLVEEVFQEARVDYITYPFDVHGSDERQYSSQAFRINTITICRDRYYEYPEYHSSLDNLNFVTAKQISKTFILYQKLIKKFEERRIYRNLFPHGEQMLYKRDLYPFLGGSLKPELNGKSELDLILWVLFLTDNRTSLNEIASILGVKEVDLEPVIKKLLAKHAIEHV